MNPLVESCIAISQAGYDRSDKLRLMYENPDFISLAKYLLNGSKLGDHVFRSKIVPYHEQGTVCIMYGAGIDSYCAMALASKTYTKVICVHQNYGQPYFHRENEARFRAWRTAETKYPNIQWVSPQTINLIPNGLDLTWENYIIPARNLILASIGSQYADHVWIIANKRADETVGTPDKTTRFYQEASQIFTQFYQRRIWVSSPFFSISKLESVQQFLKEGGTAEELIVNTSSCYAPVTAAEWHTDGPLLHCGTCYACYKRFKLFQALNVQHDFKVHPQHGPNWAKYSAAEAAKGRE